MEKMTAEKLMELVNGLENAERWKFLVQMYNKFFCKDGNPINEDDLNDY